MNWKKASAIILGLVVMLVWIYIPEDDYEDYDDRFTVTFTYDCREIIDDEDVPEHVMEECRKIMKELENDRPTI